MATNAKNCKIPTATRTTTVTNAKNSKIPAATRTITKRATKVLAHKARDFSGSVFDRLYKTPTASSKIRKTTGPVLNKCILACRDEKVSASTTKTASSRNTTVRVTRRGTNSKSTAMTSKSKKGSTTPMKGTSSSSERVTRSAMKPKNHL